MSNRGKWFCVFFLCLTLLLIDVRAVVVIKMGTQAPKGSAWEQILAEMAFKWKQETQGGVQLKIYAGGVVGDEGDMIRKMRIGQLQAVAVSDAGLADIDSSAFALMIPLMFQGYDDWDFVRERINPEMEMRLADKGFTVLTWSDVGWVHFFSKQRLLTPRDLERMQLAASSTQPRTVEILRWAGFSPVPIPTSELVTGLKTGLINAFYVPVIFAEASNLYRDAPNMNGMRWAPLQGALIVRNEDWHRIPAQYQPRLGEIAREVGTRLGRAVALPADLDDADRLLPHEKGHRHHLLDGRRLVPQLHATQPLKACLESGRWHPGDAGNLSFGNRDAAHFSTAKDLPEVGHIRGDNRITMV